MSGTRRPLRVAWFGHAEGRRGDGLSTYSRETVRVLGERGVQVLFVAHREDGDTAPVDSPLWLRAWHWKTVVLPRAGTRRRIAAALSDFAPDVVHISWSFSLLDGAIARAAHACGAVCVATFHLPHGPEGTARARVLQGLYRYHRQRMRHVDRCITLSTEQAGKLAMAGYPEERISVIPNAVDTDAITPGPSSLHAELRAGFVALYLGRLDPEKRVLALIDAFTSLGLPDDHVLCIAGDGILAPRVQRLAALHPQVRYLGLVSGTRRLELLRGSDIVVLPSTAEGLALSMLEAMSAGRAVIATDAGEDGRALEGAGVVVPTHPLRPALDEALRRLAGDAAERQRLGQLARRRAVERFAMSAHADALLSTYDAAIRAAAGTPGSAVPAALP
ncbi:MAG: glycosyltransferase family 4 protein [Candidatus Dormibacteria bacterium]